MQDCKFADVSMEALQGQAFVEQRLSLKLDLQMSVHAQALFCASFKRILVIVTSIPGRSHELFNNSEPASKF
jgi:hypothetical protein